MFTELEHDPSVNTAAMLEALPRVIEALGAQADLLVDSADLSRANAHIRVTVPGAGARTYVVEVKRRLTPGLATAVRQADGPPVLLVAPHVTEGVGDVLRAMSVDYVDMAGNGYLRWPGVHIDVRGRRAPKRSTSEPAAENRAFTKAGLRVLFVLLTVPSAATATLRQLADASGTSLGTTQAVVGQLESRGSIVSTPSGRRLTHVGRLYDRWVEAYATRLASSLTIRSFRAERIDWWPSAQDEDPDLVVGGETAAAALDPMLRPASVTFYVTGTPTWLIRRQRLVPAPAPEANVHLRRRFWNADVVQGDDRFSPITLVYADLVTSGEPRLREHAERLRRTDARLVELDRS